MDSEVFVAASFVWVGLIVSHHKTSDTLRLALYQLINVNWQNYEQEIMPQSQLISSWFRAGAKKPGPRIVDALAISAFNSSFDFAIV